MAEQHRLTGTTKDGSVTLILTDTHLQVVPSAEFLDHLKSSMDQGRMGARAGGKVISWIVNKALDVADDYIERAMKPHPLQETELLVQHDHITVKFGRANFGIGAITVDATEAYIFDAKYRAARERVG